MPDGPSSVHLAEWPKLEEPDVELLEEIATMRRVVNLGRKARAQSGLRARQPLRRLIVEGASLSDEHAAQVRDELRVKKVEVGPVEMRYTLVV